MSSSRGVLVSGLKGKLAVLALASLAAMQAGAAENGGQRYSPGVGGSDMTSPLIPGWYAQMPMVAYYTTKVMGNDGKQAVLNTGPLAAYQAKQSIHAASYALLPRLTFLDTKRVWGANVGWTAMLPLVKRRATFDMHSASANAMVNGLLSNAAAASNGSEFGIGDAEVSPIMRWEIGDHQSVVFAPTLVIPTGDYNALQRINPGFGNFFTFRPSVQYAFIGDGWDVGARGVLSFNTRNKDNGYYSGRMFNLDFQVMAFVSDNIRVGAQGYVVRQLSADTQNLDGFSSTQQAALATKIDLSTGNKSRVNAIGPAAAWLYNGGEMLIEGKFLKEFDARNRTEGRALWLTVSRPL